VRRLAFASLLFAIGCGGAELTPPEAQAVDSAYDAYGELSQTILDAPNCQVAADRANDVWRDRADDFAEARKIENDPDEMTRATPAMILYEAHYKEVAALLDAATTRCADEPGLQDIFDALDE
jgi:hypothetical protein